EEVAGTAVLEEEIPEGFEFIVAESDPSWNLVDGKYVLTTDEILPGSIKEYTVVLRWLVSETNKGTKTNKAEITGTENGANYNETTLDDNKDRAIINITLEQTNEDIDEPEVDIKDKELEPELIAPDKETKDEKKSKSIKTGDEVIYYIVGMAIAGVIMVISIKKRLN
ncbi:MAG: hypothetical protein IKE91_08200, partial [Clostridia bacterium]|nr:hypothetical protein [Clostridia bacterium]